MEWHISFYNQKVETETLSFPKGILANFLHIAEMIEELGLALGGYPRIAILARASSIESDFSII